jgi:hypothetical protein
MKSPSSSSATLKFASPEINVGIDAAKGKKSKAMPMATPAAKMPKDKKMIMPKTKGVPAAIFDPKPTKKRIPKRKK